MRITTRYIGYALLFALAACSRTHIGGEENASYTLSVKQVTPELIADLNAQRADIVEVPTPPLDPIAENDYLVGPGDVLFVKLSALSARANQTGDGVLFLTGLTAMPPRQIGQQVTGEGMVQVPLVGQVEAAGRTVRQLTEEITARVQTLYKHPTVEVKLLEFNTHEASITGEVNLPKRIPLENRPLRVIELVERAGGAKETADLRNATLTRENGTVVPLDLAALLLDGDARYNMLLKPNDVLNIPGNHLNKFFVFGEAVRPAQQFMRQDGKTLAEALNELDPNEITHSKDVYVIRGATHDDAVDAAMSKDAGAFESALTHVDVYEVNLSTLGGYALANQFELQPRDVVYLAEAPITGWSRFISQLLPGSVTSAVSSGALVRSTTE